MLIKRFLALIGALVLCAYSVAGTAELPCDCLADVSIDEWFPDENLNYKDRLIVSTNMNIHHGIARALFLFNIPADVSPAAVQQADIYISACSHCGGADGGLVGFYALNAPFDEDTDTWNSLQGGGWDEAVHTEAVLPSGSDWNQAVDGEPPGDVVGLDVTALLQENLEKVRSNGIMMRFVDEHQDPYTHQNVASRESEDPLDFHPYLVIRDTAADNDTCPAEAALGADNNALNTVRRFRDQVLARVPGGPRYIRLYYRHAPELARLVQLDQNLRNEAAAVLRELVPHIAALQTSPGQQRSLLPPAAQARLRHLVERLEKSVSPECSAALQQFRKDCLERGRCF